MTRRLLPLALAIAAFAAPSSSAIERTVTFKPLNCSVTVAVRDVSILPSDPPQVRSTGWTGAVTDCP